MSRSSIEPERAQRGGSAALPGAGWRGALRRRRAWLAVAFGLALAAAVPRLFEGADAGSPEASLAAVFAAQGLAVEPGSIVWLEGPRGLLPSRRAVFLASRGDELADVYLATVDVGPGALVRGASPVANLTRTSAADEMQLVKFGDYVAFVSRVGGLYDAFVLLDPSGEPAEVVRGWPRLARLQNWVTNYQETGQGAGVGRWRFRLDPPAEALALEAAGAAVAVRTDGATLSVDLDTKAVVGDAAGRVELQPPVKGQPGKISWVVDTVRRIPWVGPAPIEWLEHRVFAAKDAAERLWFAVFGADTEDAVSEELVVPTLGDAAEATRRAALAVTDPELGWPPAPLAPVLSPAARGEGEWLPVVDDPFVRTYPGAPPAFYQSFVRADPDREFTRVYVVLWDPRQVQLHVMTGTREPESATGETGPGMAPRTPEVLGRIVGGFNGGFQSMHGEFGMVVDRRVYLPPKPWAATVAVHDDGRVTMGSWLPPPRGATADRLEAWATDQIPADIVALRQNLTSVVEDGTWNPWERWWWGAAPTFANEQTYIDRSGLCLTAEGFFAFFWGESMGPEALGRAMLAARCARGMHLDMNSVHTGFEFYDARPEGEPFAPLGRALDDAEYEGPLPETTGWNLRARKAVRSMRPMRFPRWIRRDPRDFFFLTLKPTLPGPPVRLPAGPGSVSLSSAGLPHGGWPPAFARAEIPDGRAWLVRVDPQRALAGPVTDAFPPRAPRPLAALARVAGVADAAPAGSTGDAAVRPRRLGWLALGDAAESGASLGLYALRGPAGLRYAVGSPPAGALVVGRGPSLDRVPDARGALGVDGDGFLVLASVGEGGSADVRALLRAAGVGPAIALDAGGGVLFDVDGEAVRVDGQVGELPAGAVELLASERPAAEVLFPDIEPAPYRVWGAMQDVRVRYIRTKPPRFKLLGGGRVEDNRGRVDGAAP